jgi:large subunit ribosomal protein L4
MIELPIINSEGKQVDVLKIDEAVLGGEIRHALLKQAYVVTHGNQRQGSARTKSRGSVEGSTRKLYKQKGTGNARVGASRVPNRKGRPAPARTSAPASPRRCAAWPTATRCSRSWSTTR